MEIGQQIAQENNGFVQPTMASSSNPLEGLLLPIPLYEI